MTDKLKTWAPWESIEESAQKQLRNTASLPWVPTRGRRSRTRLHPAPPAVVRLQGRVRRWDLRDWRLQAQDGRRDWARHLPGRASMTPSERQALRELCEAATPGPWRPLFVGGQMSPALLDEWTVFQVYVGFVTARCEASQLGGTGNKEAAMNARFIASSRTALPALLDRVEVLEELLRRADHWRHAERVALADYALWDEIRAALKVTP